MRALRTIATSALRATAGAASVGSSVLDRTAGLLRRASGDSGHEIDVEHRATFRVVEPRRAEPAPGASAPAPAPPETPAPAPAAAPKAPAASKAPSAAARGARISNPKAARAVRKRQKASTPGPAEVPGDTRHGGHPVTVEAENTPSELAKAKAGKQPAPMGAREPS